MKDNKPLGFFKTNPINILYIYIYIYKIQQLTVQLYLTQSAQNWLAENLRRMTMVVAPSTACPTPRIPPAVWYSGSVLYITSSRRMLYANRDPNVM